MPNATLQSISSGGTSPQQCQPLAGRSTSKCRAQFFRRARSALRPNKWLQTELTSHLKVAGDVHLCHQAKRGHASAGRACRVARACSAAWARPRARRGRAAAWAQRRWARGQQPLRILAERVRSRGRAGSGGSGWFAQELSNSGLPKPLTQNSEKPYFSD